MTTEKRLRRLEAKIDECEYKLVYCLIARKTRMDYWRSTREIRRGVMNNYRSEK